MAAQGPIMSCSTSLLLPPGDLAPMLLLSRFSVRLCATPETAAHQAPLSLRFSRQEHWSRLPFPSPMHESENESDSYVHRGTSTEFYSLQLSEGPILSFFFLVPGSGVSPVQTESLHLCLYLILSFCLWDLASLGISLFLLYPSRSFSLLVSPN